MSRSSSFRLVPFLIGGGLLLVAALGYALYRAAPPPPGAPGVTVGQLAPTGAPSIGGPFRLVNDTGEEVTEATLVGEKYHLIFFGFANCPDVCPGMLQLMAGIEDKLPASTRDKLQFVFVSVDPNRDTLENLGKYVRDFSPNFVGWTGEQAEIDRMVKNYLAYYAFRPIEGGSDADYTVDHSGFAYLMGPDGHYRTHVSSKASAIELQETLERLVI